MRVMMRMWILAMALMPLHSCAPERPSAAAPVSREIANAPDENGYTPLMQAAWRGEIEKVRAFIRQGADVNARSHTQWTALMGAAKGGSAECVRALVQAGADLEARWHEGSTPLLIATAFGTRESMQALLDAGANVNAEDRASTSALIHAALRKDAAKTAALLKAGAALDDRNAEGFTPLCLAAMYGDAATVKILIDAGASLEASDHAGFTPLLRAVESDAGVEVVRLLLAAGADVNHAAPGASALALAVVSGSIDKTRLLLEAGARLDWRDEFDGTVLHLAVQTCDPALVRLLLPFHNLPIDGREVRDVRGRTPLHWAAEGCGPDVIRHLLDAGADRQGLDGRGWSAIDIAVSRTDALRDAVRTELKR